MIKANKSTQKSENIKLSKSLSWLLRHGAEKEGLLLDEGGFIDVQSVLKLKQFRSYNENDIERIVEQNDKKRFSLRIKTDDNSLQIRANQGHSIKVNDRELLTLLTLNETPPLVYHGTYFSKLDSIKARGLSRMNRNHIHFTSVFPGSGSVISGMRQNCEIVISIDAHKAMADGYKLYKSDNDVILCSGNESGCIPAKYFKEIWQLNPLKRIE